MSKIYYNARCSKCRAALCELQDRGEDVQVIEYLKEPISEEELTELIQLLGIHPFDLVRTKEALFREKFSQFGREYNWIKVLSENPKLMERPIFVKNKRAVIGRPPVKVLDLL